ncbi:G-patch domain-containing protein [Melia azedarach]|uniref:G-patch domain-containing protein n=1 Tax=Melia azedarach TaxID=155640 RepID=A0ACC1XEI1_MELAZ|nr:G-patch domain-containing protein [Melia azedarach]
MGGGSRRTMNSNSGNKSGKDKSKRRWKADTTSSGGRVRNSLFVEGGVLSDWQQQQNSFSGGKKLGVNSDLGSKSGNSNASKASVSKSGPKKSNRNAVGHQYPSLEIKDSKIIAYVDQTPDSKSQNVSYCYDYDSSFVLGDSSHRGLGFGDESEATPSGMDSSSRQKDEREVSGSDSPSFNEGEDIDENVNREDDVEELPNETLSPRKNSGFLSIGGMKVYTQDMSDEESDDEKDGESPDDESSESYSGSDSSEDLSDSDLDIDDEIAEDYLEGIGGSSNLLDAKWLVEHDFDGSDDDSSTSSGVDGASEKLGGIALQDASKEYGMKKPLLPSRRKNSVAPRDLWSPALDDLMLVKDPRTVSGKKKQVACLPQSWLREAKKSKKSRNFPGEKKKHRKETIAAKRRERMLHRGVDLEEINLTLEQIVLEGIDIFSFQPMHHRDCSQVRRLAAIYRLQSGAQGSGKKRFVTVTRTQHTCMPSSADKLRLEKLIGAGDEDIDFAVNEGPFTKPASADRNRSKSSKNVALRKSSSEPSKMKGSRRKHAYANQPMSFVSSGTMQPDTVEIGIIESAEISETFKGKVGAFEVHTKGFGSKMMAKMGYVEGGGLGKDGQGMSKPIEVIQRPKSLGLGVEFSGTDDTSAGKESRGDSGRKESCSNSSKKGSQSIGAFEKHTKGFGSKMMAKMGFVEGTGLGKDSQGIINPLVAVKRPKSRGLGAKS